MFKSITLENFFSFGKSTKVELNPGVNILVGINGSGKSNFLRVLEILLAGLGGDGVRRLVNGDWGGILSLFHSGEGAGSSSSILFQIPAYKLDANASANGAPIFEYRLTMRAKGNSDFEFQESLRTPGTSHFRMLNSSFNEFLGGDMSGKLFADRASITEDELAGINIGRPVLVYKPFDTSGGGKLRSLAGYQDHPRLLPDGENLVGLLSYLNTNDLKTFDLISSKLREVNPNFKELAFSVPIAGKTLMALKEKQLNRAVPIDFISDGTLRFLLLLSILYNPKRGAVVCLDEPEMGLHPDMISTVAEGIKYAAQTGTQMIVSTHSPLLLNAFELNDILIFEKDSENQTIVNRKSEEDFQDWQGEFLAGQMWMRGQLGGTRW